MPLGKRRVGIVFIHGGEVVKDVFLSVEHAMQAVLNDDRQFIGIGRVVGDTVGNEGGMNLTVSVLVLQPFAIQGGPSRRPADEEAATLHVPCRPGQITDALKTEHGIKNIERESGDAMGGIRRGGGDPGRESAGFIDPFLKDLTIHAFAVVHQLIMILGFVQLPHGRIDAQATEHALHAEGTGFVGNNGDDALTQCLIADE